MYTIFTENHVKMIVSIFGHKGALFIFKGGIGVGNMIHILDITIDNGLSYSVVSPFSHIESAKAAVRKIFKKYNKDNKGLKNGEKAHYKYDKWQEISPGYFVYPFGPGSEYRIRRFKLDDLSFLEAKEKLDGRIVKQALDDTEKKILKEAEKVQDICKVVQ